MTINVPNFETAVAAAMAAVEDVGNDAVIPMVVEIPEGRLIKGVVVRDCRGTRFYRTDGE